MPEITFTNQNFEKEVLKSKEPVLVDFWASWCGPCQMMMPIVEGLAKEYEGKPVKIGKLNIDENREIASRYDIMSIPTFILFKEGKIITQFSGAQAKEKLKGVIEKNL